MDGEKDEALRLFQSGKIICFYVVCYRLSAAGRGLKSQTKTPSRHSIVTTPSVNPTTPKT